VKVYEGANIRNVALVGHGHAGKTSLVSAALYTAGATQRMGRVDDGSATTDYDEEEIARQMSVGTGIAFAEWGKTKINLLDTPGFNMFVHEAKTVLPVVEAALVEFAFTAAERRGPVTQALFAGALVGTLGLAAEWAWMAVWGRHPWTISLFPGIWAAVLVAVPAAVIGTAMGRVLALERARIPALAVALALLAVVGLLLVPLPREGTPGTVTLRTSPAGQAVADLVSALVAEAEAAIGRVSGHLG